MAICSGALDCGSESLNSCEVLVAFFAHLANETVSFDASEYGFHLFFIAAGELAEGIVVILLA